MGKIDLRWIEDDRLGLEVQVGTVTIHQRNHLRRDQWDTMILSPNDLRALVKALDRKKPGKD